MATIREELVLYDKFTNTFTSYIRQGEQAASVTKAAQDATEKFTKSQKEAADSTSKLTGTVKNLVGAYVGLQGLKSLFNLSDSISQTNARLDQMNEKFKTSGDLNDMIYQSAMRSRAAYQSTADFVSKLGTLAGNAFDSGKELVDFAEQINKQIALSGASSQAADAAMLQLTQGLSSGALRGEELNSVLEQTPMIAQTIASYLNMTTGEMREFASEGKLTADIVKNAMLDAAKKTNEKFNDIPLTWGQVWTMAQNIAIKALNPVLTAISWLANNIEIIGPIVLGLGTAFAIFLVAANWIKICKSATNALTTAQNMLKAATATTWAIPLIAIALVIAAIYALVAVYNKLTGSTVSATGIIAGAFFAAGTFIANNTIIPLQRIFATFANFIGNVFNDPVTAVKVLFYDLAITVIGYIQKIAGGIESLINAIPGVEVNLTSGIDNLYNTLQSKRQDAIDAGSYKEYIKPWEYKDLGEAFSSGYDWGSNLAGNLGDMFSSGTSAFAGGTSFDDLAGDVSSIAGDVGSIEKSVNMADEDLKSLVDMAERRYVNNINLTSQTPVINITGQNTGDTAADRRALANAIKDILVEQVAAGSVRTTARAF